MSNENPSELQVCEIVQAVTSSYLQRDTALSSVPSVPLPEPWTGFVGVTGAFTGFVVFECGSSFAKQAAESIFGGPADDDAAREALAELTNIVGGNVKALLAMDRSGNCALSLPTVVAGPMTLRTARVVRELWCTCDGEPIRIRVYEAPRPAEQTA